MTANTEPATFRLGTVRIGPKDPVRLLAIINVSPESFYPGSVALGRQAVRDRAEQAANEGADILDIGAMSTAPYKETFVTAEQEAERLVEAIEAAREASGLPISADTARASVAAAALTAGATIINDVSGLAGDPEMAELAAKRGAGVILMANEDRVIEGPDAAPPHQVVRTILADAAERARKAGIPKEHIVIDPGIGFFRSQPVPWYDWDMDVLQHLRELNTLGFPQLVSVSRKSFIGHLLGRKQASDRLPGSLAGAIWCANHGVRVIRTHDVQATRDALRLWVMLSQHPA
ncbi:dihydropteroate synthase [bacterium]|nr:dihydropteroate synthase [bacterium]